jgi:hypothetical protein
MIGRCLRRANVGVMTYNRNSLRSQLVHLKDPIPHNHRTSVVYHASCAGRPLSPCSARYIGEMERAMSIRLKEHHNRTKLPSTNDYALPIGQHSRTTNHHFRPEDVTYLANKGNKTKRGIKEAIFARTLDPSSTEAVDYVTTSPMPMTPYSKQPSAPEAPTSKYLNLTLARIQHKRNKTCRPTCWSPEPPPCLPLVDAAITPAAAPAGTLPTPQPPTRPKRGPGRPRTKPAAPDPIPGTTTPRQPWPSAQPIKPPTPCQQPPA